MSKPSAPIKLLCSTIVKYSKNFIRGNAQIVNINYTHMSRHEPFEIFNKQWRSIKNPKSKIYQINRNYKSDNCNEVEIAIFLNDECIGFGKYFDVLKLPQKDGERYYFHGAGFIGCGVHTKIWFYFDDKNIIINNLNYIYPFDELMIDYDNFFQRIEELQCT